ncbi:protein of unknown function [Methylorubrum extorquens]|uniref:Galactosyltransferase C-terminal domain-containing protein n=1 Tax=Methylorubrum extorquens TaxID=408 RepID=A0A2N9AH92_METEX|nr:protein of unknown function [Methylorubrum extorquens]
MPPRATGQRPRPPETSSSSSTWIVSRVRLWWPPMRTLPPRSGGLFLGEVLYLPPDAIVGGTAPDPAALDRLGRAHPARPPLPETGLRREPDAGQLWGLSFALPAEAWHAVGGMDERYVGYGGEETDLAARLAGVRATDLLGRGRAGLSPAPPGPRAAAPALRADPRQRDALPRAARALVHDVLARTVPRGRIDRLGYRGRGDPRPAPAERARDCCRPTASGPLLLVVSSLCPFAFDFSRSEPRNHAP